MRHDLLLNNTFVFPLWEFLKSSFRCLSLISLTIRLCHFRGTVIVFVLSEENPRLTEETLEATTHINLFMTTDEQNLYK